MQIYGSEGTIIQNGNLQMTNTQRDGRIHQLLWNKPLRQHMVCNFNLGYNILFPIYMYIMTVLL